MFTERKIAAFQHKIADLPDTPTLTASELKARFDACPEQLRQALNAVCDDGKALENRIDAYRAQTFTGEITETMLAEPLADKINAKATQTSLAAETQARTALAARVTAAENALAQKCEAVFGTYTGNGAYPRTISLGFTPQAVIIGSQNGLVGQVTEACCALMVKGQSTNLCSIVTNGFTLYSYQYSYLNSDGARFFYIAFK